MPATEKTLRQGLAALLTGNGLVQVGSLALAPILTRLYAPEDFGVLALVMIGAGLVAMVGTLRLEYAVIIPRSDAEGAAVLRTALLTLLLTAALAGVLYIVLRPVAAVGPALRHWGWIGIFIGTMMGLYQVFFQYRIRRKAYRRAAVGQALTGLGYPVAAILYGRLVGASADGLLYGMGGAYAAAALITMPAPQVLRQTARISMGQVLRRFRRFPLFNLPHALINFGSGNLPYLMIAGPFGKEAVGQVSMAIGKVFKGIQWWGGSLYPVLSREVMTCLHEGRPALPLVMRIVKRQAGYGLPLFAGLGVAAPWFFGWFFGPQWDVAGRYLRYLLPWLFMVFLTGPLSFIPNVLGRQKGALGWEVFSLVLRLAGIGIGVAMGSIEGALAGYSAAGVISLGLLFRWYIRLLARQDAHHQNAAR